MKIGFIGLGNMGASLAKSVLQAKTGAQILLANRSQAKVDAFIADFGGQASSNEEIFAEADVIFLGVKPAQVSTLLAESQDILEKRESLLLISMAAGIKLEKLASLVPSQHRLIRMMPNTPVSIGQGVISYALSANCQVDDKEVFCQLLQHAGLLFEISEGLIDAATGLAGCGPAFVYLFIEALADAGVQTGLPRETALQMAAQTVVGAGQLVLESQQHPGVLKDQVCSPGGSTIAGVASLEAHAFRGTVMEAVKKAYKRTKKLGK
ncbi:pyrroline-5-carboxylate reductase [Streptococcus mitis]|uniref:Pyrroline-5-carboxylate reductase n=2 Tax=Streptococcus TaxID=1301 RepID=A0A2N6P5X0_STROR|nr:MULTISPECIES: pyrroline-5-carboxylate reductase [Streptococcus]PKZ98791.1 pyrroline-5-carboxylate reductase [Streptococcus mitis]PMB86097.1 pyrroline-5-carboxylate reductase [Streptococcus oralis subsp. dentisani]